MEIMSHFDLADEEFLRRFADLSLKPQWFDHIGHLRLAFLLIKRHGIEEAPQLICQQIKAFDACHGDGTKFHHTLTVAAVYTVHHFVLKLPEATFKELIEAFPRLQFQFQTLIKTHYSQEHLDQPEARFNYVKPDLLPYDA